MISTLSRLWGHSTTRSLIYQGAIVLLVSVAVLTLVESAANNLQRLGIRTGFEFLSDEAGFVINQALFPYGPTSSYGMAILVCLVNTLILSLLGILTSTALGFFVAIARLSRNWLLRALAGAYVELFRNVPLLLQLFFWYFATLRLLPGKRESLSLFDLIYLNIEGLFIPAPVFGQGATLIGGSILVSIVIAGFTLRVARQRRESTGRRFQHARYGYAAAVLLPIATLAALDFPVSWDVPVFKRFNFEGGFALQPEFVAMLLAITLYNAAFIGEIIRAGIMSVHKGQREAARAIGLTAREVYTVVIIPQAMRLIVPPLTNQYLNLTKATALAGAIGYPDLFWAVGGSIQAQTGQILELQAITLAAYLGISLLIALLLNSYNRATQLKGRS